MCLSFRVLRLIEIAIAAGFEGWAGETDSFPRVRVGAVEKDDILPQCPEE
jgi:hypothetical protein